MESRHRVTLWIDSVLGDHTGDRRSRNHLRLSSAGLQAGVPNDWPSLLGWLPATLAALTPPEHSVSARSSCPRFGHPRAPSPSSRRTALPLPGRARVAWPAAGESRAPLLHTIRPACAVSTAPS